LTTLNIGIEQGDYTFRKEILNRKIENKRIIESVKICTKQKVRIGANVIIGFPTETREHIFKTIDLIRKSSPDFSMIHLFQPYAKTLIRQKCIDENLINDNFICKNYWFNAIPTGNLSQKEIFGLLRTFHLYVSYPKTKWEKIRKAEKFNEEGNEIFKKLAKEYQLKHFGRTSF
ncbi:MAG TPA: hypothetical protein VMZ91_11835, partial [Candidatus Paceibacterota bacterium]|nr:hypothetical protein [Candidatus Paceibacterota bacterium]